MASIRVFSLFVFILSLFLLYESFGIKTEFAYEPLGPRAFPLSALILIALGFFLLFFFAEKTEVKWNQQALIKIAFLLIVFFLFAFLFEIIGFIPSSIIFLFCAALIFGARLIPAFVFAVLCAILFFVGFDTLMQITLPQGTFFEKFFYKKG
ncbi:tripartite tricarboxylate transporter TctB family protein [Campylobacter sp. MIT 21-1685]|uniref:tripartite tricarboxylate transporter TctB family protein n=1 Tax=unclassified Campylobacter TaxID=2593542 RepID=UPI00224A7B61|nr:MULTISPECIES: tripartite tricarboxylate transporter TctB family protein [unclassified Campylobacter]MCX2683018.1 tripartite tricarboxylate transporter TctB family protein [Campylobacter sp. MIT 21-1684]MCX2751300.1 tripartite tricarboxylate transporter TctB family protein [Campylobacter sp. MIT 21-1682]MCX2807499.1 tripartite tricarboxylate transporter TctB family protein [Campylobacter sp. MIT 21-1685]